MRYATLVATVLCLFATAAAADELIVPSAEYPTIQSAVDAAVDGDEVVLLDGVFTGPGNWDVVVPAREICIRGASGDPTLSRIVGSGDPYEAAHFAFDFVGDRPSHIIVRDLTIADFAEGDGRGAVRIGVSSPTFANVHFLQNVSTNDRVLSTARGGAIWAWESYSVFKQCKFLRNAATPVFADFGVGNGYGGAVYALESQLQFLSSEFDGNFATEIEFGVSRGGAIYIEQGHVRFDNCVFLRNDAEDDSGDAMYTQDARILMSSSTVSGVGGRPQTIWIGDGSMQATNSVFHGPYRPFTLFGSAEAAVSWSLVKQGWPGEGNIDLDPMLDLLGRPNPVSPCIDAGNTALLPTDRFDLDGDGDTTEPIPFDADGLARFVDDPATPDTGMGFPVVDMGAFEYQPPCRVDMDGDGALTIFDFLAFFNAFDDADPVADFDGDGAFTVFDFLAFQNEFDAGCA